MLRYGAEQKIRMVVSSVEKVADPRMDMSESANEIWNNVRKMKSIIATKLHLQIKCQTIERKLYIEMPNELYE